MIARDFTDLIGDTPLAALTHFGAELRARLYAKLEYFNPAGSVKDRAALFMIRDAEARGLLQSGATIIEPTSGNTGIGLAAIATSRGYRVILTMPESMSVERRKLLAAYGAELVLTPGETGMAGAIEKARDLAKSIPHSFIPGQFENPANAQAHYATTGPEILRALDGKVDAFVACVGTGGTISGTGRYLKEKAPGAHIVAVEPFSSQVLAGKPAAPHKIQGIGANFVPAVLERGVIDELLPVRDEDAMLAMRTIARTEGYLVGISSGAALYAAMEIARRDDFVGKNIVALLPDTGERYLSAL